MKFGINMAALMLSGLVVVGCNKDADKQAAAANQPAKLDEAKKEVGENTNMATTKASDMTSKADDAMKSGMGKVGDMMKTGGDKMKASTQP